VTADRVCGAVPGYFGKERLPDSVSRRTAAMSSGSGPEPTAWARRYLLGMRRRTREGRLLVLEVEAYLAGRDWAVERLGRAAVEVTQGILTGSPRCSGTASFPWSWYS